MYQIGESFEFSVPIVKSEVDDRGDVILEACASTPDRDLQGEVVDPSALDTSYLFGKGLPEGAGGYRCQLGS